MGISLLLLVQGIYVPAKAWLSQKLIIHSWQQTLKSKQPSPPWPWADTTAIAKMEVKRLNQSTILLKGTDPTTLAFSAGVMHQYASLKNNRPFVVAGHRDTNFSFLEEIQLRDMIKIYDINGNIFLYKVENIEVMNSLISPLLLDETEPALVLITCYPFNALIADGSLRYVIKAKKILRL